MKFELSNRTWVAAGFLFAFVVYVSGTQGWIPVEAADSLAGKALIWGGGVAAGVGINRK